MPAGHKPPEDIWRRLRMDQVEVLRCLAEGLTEREIAERLGRTLPAVRDTIATLRRLTSIRRGADMGAWWASYRPRYVAFVARAAGLDF